MHDNLHSVAFGFATPGFYYLSWAVIFFFLMVVKYTEIFPGGSVLKNLPANAGEAGSRSLIWELRSYMPRAPEPTGPGACRPPLEGSPQGACLKQSACCN